MDKLSESPFNGTKWIDFDDGKFCQMVRGRTVEYKGSLFRSCLLNTQTIQGERLLFKKRGSKFGFVLDMGMSIDSKFFKELIFDGRVTGTPLGPGGVYNGNDRNR